MERKKERNRNYFLWFFFFFSMEEADVLCTRIGIMAQGELRALGRRSKKKKRKQEQEEVR